MMFFNSTRKNMSFTDVIACIKYFIRINPDSKFIIAVGTDSQVRGRQVSFATGIHIHRVGQGAWCCVTKRLENKRYTCLEDKIAQEAAKTFEIANALKEQLMDVLYGFAVKYKNFDLRLEVHMDIGNHGESRKLVREMVGFFEGVGIEAKIKPEAFVASSYADRYSRWNKAV